MLPLNYSRYFLEVNLSYRFWMQMKYSLNRILTFQSLKIKWSFCVNRENFLIDSSIVAIVAVFDGASVEDGRNNRTDGRRNDTYFMSDIICIYDGKRYHNCSFSILVYIYSNKFNQIIRPKSVFHKFPMQNPIKYMKRKKARAHIFHYFQIIYLHILI